MSSLACGSRSQAAFSSQLDKNVEGRGYAPSYQNSCICLFVVWAAFHSIDNLFAMDCHGLTDIPKLDMSIIHVLQRQRESLILWFQGSFALLQCFIVHSFYWSGGGYSFYWSGGGYSERSRSQYSNLPPPLLLTYLAAALASTNCIQPFFLLQ